MASRLGARWNLSSLKRRLRLSLRGESGIKKGAKALVDIDGSVRDAMIFVSSNSKAGFDDEALRAAYKCKYKPAIHDGRPVPIWVSYKVEFVLEDSR